MNLLDNIKPEKREQFKRDMELYRQRYNGNIYHSRRMFITIQRSEIPKIIFHGNRSMPELVWNGDGTMFNGYTYKVVQALQGRTNCPAAYMGLWYVQWMDHGKFLSNSGKEFVGWVPEQVMFKSKEWAKARLEQAFGFTPSMCLCETSVLMTQGCHCGAFKREREKRGTRV